MMLRTMGSRHAIAACLIAILISGCASAPSQPSAAIDESGPVGGVIVADSGLESGIARYSIHVDVPPGRDDVAPNFDIKYSTRSGNGLLGMGWFLTLSSTISRCPATPASDGYAAGVSGTMTDRLCLGDSHLVLTSGAYGRSGSTYQPELADGDEVMLNGDIEGPSSYFVVIYSDGSRAFYRQAIVPIGGKGPIEWYMSRYVGTHAGTIDYLYDNSLAGEPLLSEIRYTGREVNGVATLGTRFVRFSYETRPDITSAFAGAGEVRQSRRLAALTIGMGADKAPDQMREVSDYSFSYVQSRTTGRSLLSAVHKCLMGNDGVKQCFAPTKFTWENEALVFNDPVLYTLPQLDAGLGAPQLIDATSILRSPYIVSGDFDGDGRREILYFRPDVGAHLYFMNPDGTLRKDVDVSKFFQSPPEVLFHSSAVDVDNDGAADLPGNSHGHLAFASWNGTDMGTPVETDIPYSAEMALTYVSDQPAPFGPG